MNPPLPPLDAPPPQLRSGTARGPLKIHIKMKIFYQPPSTPEGKRFFSRYAALIPNLTVAGYLAQLVSALTEWGILYALLFTSLAPLWPEYAAAASIGGATVGVAIIEIGLRRLLPFASRAVILKQWKGYDGGISAVVLVATLLLLGASATLSFTGSRSLVSAVATPPTLASSTASDKLADREGSLAKASWEKDEADVAGSYAARITATRTSTSATIRRIQGRIDQLKAKERTSDQRYTTRIAELERDEAEALANRDEKVAGLTEEREAALVKVRDRYRGKLDAIEVDKVTTRANVAQANEAAMVDHQLTVSHHGGGLAWFTVVCLVILLVSVVVKELHHAGAGIEERVQPDAFTFEEGPLLSLYKALTARLRREVYCLVNWVERTTPDALPPVQSPVLWEREDDWRVKVTRAAEHYPEVTRATPPPQPVNGGIDPSQEPATDEIDAFENASENASAEPNWTVELQTEEVAPRELAGLVDALTHIDESDQDDGDQEACENCGEGYDKTRSWQRFCGEKCRKAFHAKQHNGVPFIPGIGGKQLEYEVR